MEGTPGFAGMGLRAELNRALEIMGLTTPTAIQARAIAPILAGQDVVLRAETGSGKTLAYGLPLLNGIAATAQHPRMLVLVPTRELALQVRDVLRDAARRWRPPIHVLVGGEPIDAQIKALAKGAAVLVGTPGRVLDLLERGEIETKHCRHLVLDEVDEMILRGFKDQLAAILAKLPTRRQTVLASATMAPEIESYIQETLREPLSVDDGSVQREAAHTLEHLTVLAPRDGKLAVLTRILAGVEGPSIVFVARKDQTKRLTMQLRQAGYAAAYLMGDLPQENRNETMRRFRDGFFQVLVATDVAARGLDVPEVDWVINYVVPPNADQYVHRAGRAGRAGRPGRCVTIYYREERDALKVVRERVTFKEYRPPASTQAASRSWRPPQDPSEVPVERAKAPRRGPKVSQHLEWQEDRPTRERRARPPADRKPGAKPKS